MKFKIEYKNPADLIPYKQNAKTHPDKQVDLIKYSIDNFDFDQPVVVDEHNEIIKGHGRTIAAMQLGIDKVPVIVRTDLNETQKRAARLADNRSAESPLDLGILDIELGELGQDFNLDDIGFDTEYLKDIGFPDETEGNENTDKESPEDFKEYDEDIETEYCCPKCGYGWSGKAK